MYNFRTIKIYVPRVYAVFVPASQKEAIEEESISTHYNQGGWDEEGPRELALLVPTIRCHDECALDLAAHRLRNDAPSTR